MPQFFLSTVCCTFVELRADDRHHFGAHHFNGVGIPRHHPLHDGSMAMIERSLNPLADPNHPSLTNHIAELEQLRRVTHSQEHNGITAPHPVYNSGPGMLLKIDSRKISSGKLSAIFCLLLELQGIPFHYYG